MGDIDINYQPFEDDVVIVGGKGRGKTKRCMWLLSGIYQTSPTWIWDFQDHYNNFGTIIHSIDELVVGKHCVYQGNKTDEYFSNFCKKISDEAFDTVIVFEEIQRYVTKQALHKWVDAIVTSKRNDGISSIFVTPRPQKIPNDILSMANLCFAYGLNNRGDIDWLKDYIGDMAEALFPLDKRKKINDRPMFEDIILTKHDCLFRHQLEEECQIIRGY